MALADCTPVSSVEQVDPSLAPPTITLSAASLTQSGVVIPALQATWGASTNLYITGIQFEYFESSGAGPATRSAPQGILAGLWQATNNIVAGKTYTVRYRAVSAVVVGNWITHGSNITMSTAFTAGDTANVGGVPSSTVLASLPGADTTPPAAPTSLSATAAFQSIFLQWTCPADADVKSIEIWEHTADVRASATKIGTADASKSSVGFFGRTGLTPGTLRYYWVRAVDTAGNIGPFNGTSGTPATTASLAIADFPASLTAVGYGSSLPTASTYAGATFYNTSDGKFYRKNTANTAWTVLTETTDLNGQITTGQITTGAISTGLIAAGAITAAKIASNTITASQIAAATITADRMSVSSLSAISANIGTVTAGVVQNSGGTTFFDLTNGRSQYAVGSYVFRLGAIGSTVVAWFGPSSVGIGSETRTNGAFAWGTDGVVYFGSGALTSGSGSRLTVTIPNSMSWSGFLSSPTVESTNSSGTPTCSGGTGTGRQTFWSVVSGDSVNVSTSSGSGLFAITVSTLVHIGDALGGAVRCTVIDDAGNVGFADTDFSFSETH